MVAGTVRAEGRGGAHTEDVGLDQSRVGNLSLGSPWTAAVASSASPSLSVRDVGSLAVAAATVYTGLFVFWALCSPFRIQHLMESAQNRTSGVC